MTSIEYIGGQEEKVNKVIEHKNFRVLFREIGTRFDDKYRVHSRAGGKGKQAGVNKKPTKIKTVWHGFQIILKLSGRVNQASLKLSAVFSNTVCWTSSTLFALQIA